MDGNHKCPSECRDEIYKEVNTLEKNLRCKLEKKLDKTTVKNTVGLLIVVAIAVWGGAYAIYAGGKQEIVEKTRRNQTEIGRVSNLQIEVVTTQRQLAKNVVDNTAAIKAVSDEIKTLGIDIIKAINVSQHGEIMQ